MTAEHRSLPNLPQVFTAGSKEKHQRSFLLVYFPEIDNFSDDNLYFSRYFLSTFLRICNSFGGDAELYPSLSS